MVFHPIRRSEKNRRVCEALVKPLDFVMHTSPPCTHCCYSFFGSSVKMERAGSVLLCLVWLVCGMCVPGMLSAASVAFLAWDSGIVGLEQSGVVVWHDAAAVCAVLHCSNWRAPVHVSEAALKLCAGKRIETQRMAAW